MVVGEGAATMVLSGWSVCWMEPSYSMGSGGIWILMAVMGLNSNICDIYMAYTRSLSCVISRVAGKNGDNSKAHPTMVTLIYSTG